MELSAVALAGLDAAFARLDRSAGAIATVTQAGSETTPLDTVDLATAMIGLVEAREEFGVNIKMLQTSDEIERRTLDILA